MLNLHLIRHAKSSWGDHRLNDHERPLDPRGRLAAPRVGQEMKQRLNEPPILFVSSARRARETFEGLTSSFPELAETGGITDDALYTFSSDVLKHWISLRDDFREESRDEPIRHLGLIGHNPAITELANYLCADLHLDNVPTGAWVWLRFDTDSWTTAVSAPGAAHCVGMIRPKALEGAAQ